MKLKLFKEYFFTTAVIIIVSFTVLMIILSIALNSYITDSKRETLELACNQVVEYYSSEKNINPNDISHVVGITSKVSETDIFICDQNGSVIICGCEDWQTNGNCVHTSSPVYEKSKYKAELNSNRFYLDTLGIFEEPHYVISRSAESQNKSVITVFAVAPTSAVIKLLKKITKIYIVSAIVPLILMFFAIYTITYKMTKPLKLMSNAAKAMAKGDFSKRIPVMSDDEIGELSVSFNMMTNSLSQLEGMRKSFVANVSHELKTPMTTIGGFIDGILDGTIEPERQNYYLNIVSDEIKRLSRLVQSMLSMSKLESGEFVLKPEFFDFRELLCNIVISQEQLIENKNINIVGLDSVDSISVNADRDLIHQAIYNLVDNAVKFTPENGKIQFFVNTENKNLVFNIVNSGHGIPQTDLPHIFERFYKVDKSRSVSKNSTGLGLYIVKTIITAHSGKITVTSKENDFTSFKVTLPLKQKE